MSILTHGEMSSEASLLLLKKKANLLIADLLILFILEAFQKICDI